MSLPIISRNVTGVSKAFYLYLLSQFISNTGDSFQLIALTTLLYKLTRSGLAAGFGVICAPVASLFLSLFAGSIGDRFNEKSTLFTINLLRSVIGVLFLFCTQVWMIYMLLFLLSALKALYYPSEKKMVVNIINSNSLMVGNSMLSSISGTAYLIGPVAAGYVIDSFGADKAFLFNAVTMVVSALIIASIKTKKVNITVINIKNSRHMKDIFADIKDGFICFRSSHTVRKLIAIGTFMCFGAASINFTFYPFAFEVLKVTGKEWGLILSIFYGTTLIVMPITALAGDYLNRNAGECIFLFMMIVSVMWFLYGSTDSLHKVLVFQVAEGIASELFLVVLGTTLQLKAKKSFLARIIGINDIFNNAAKLIGIAFTYMVVQIGSLRNVFFINSLLMALFSLVIVLSDQKNIRKITGRSKVY